MRLVSKGTCQHGVTKQVWGTDEFVRDVGDAPACGIFSGRTCRVGLEDAGDLSALGHFRGGLFLQTIQDSQDCVMRWGSLDLRQAWDRREELEKVSKLVGFFFFVFPFRDGGGFSYRHCA